LKYWTTPNAVQIIEIANATIWQTLAFNGIVAASIADDPEAIGHPCLGVD
jgi:hypothetical protein